MKPPWIPHAATLFLDHVIRPDWQVFEWGLGDSTRWLAKRAKEVISVEHSKRWFEFFGKAPDNLVIKLVPPGPRKIGSDPALPTHYCSTELPGCNFKRYASVIEGCGAFDLILIDGRARPSCLHHAVSHLKAGGYLLLDNSDRRYYLAHKPDVLDNWERYTFFGHGPRIGYKWETTIWRVLLLA